MDKKEIHAKGFSHVFSNKWGFHKANNVVIVSIFEWRWSRIKINYEVDIENCSQGPKNYFPSI